MNEDMPPLSSTIEALPTKVEPSSKPTQAELFTARPTLLEDGRVDRRRPLVEYSSSPSPLTKDDSGLLGEEDNITPQAEIQSLRNELDLSTYEYAALEERYRTLTCQHRELCKLALAYNDVIRGFSSYESLTVSIERLRAEAGNEGLRAKALETDVLRPFIRKAGGLQALAAQIQAVVSLIEAAGGLKKLHEVIIDGYMLRTRVEEVGGLQGLGRLVAEVNLLRSKQQEHAKLRASVNGLDGLKAKALKYDMLQQAFAAIQKEPVVIDHSQTGLSGGSRNSTQTTEADALPTQSIPASDTAAAMNPARARLLSAPPVESDPDRDLYEATPLVYIPNNKTGSNDVPLCAPRVVARRSVGQGYAMAQLKRKTEEELRTKIVKRPRVDVGRASALVQASLSRSSTSSTMVPRTNGIQFELPGARNTSNKGRSITEKTTAADSSKGSSFQYLNRSTSRQVRFDGTPDRSAAHALSVPGASTATTPTGSYLPNEGHIHHHVERMASVGLMDSECLPAVKTETTGDELVDRPLSNLLADTVSTQGCTDVKIGSYPIALWAGSSSPRGDYMGAGLIKGSRIPSQLAKFLVDKLTMYITMSELNKMPPNNDTCILRYVVDGHRPSGQQQERRACRICSSACVRNDRPCALVQIIDGERTVVFLPLRDTLRVGQSPKEKKFWMMTA